MTPTTYHLRFIKDNYQSMTDAEIATELGVSYYFVNGLRRRNGLMKCKEKWSVIGGKMGGRPKKINN